jgi:sialate O-acetylesterase
MRRTDGAFFRLSILQPPHLMKRILLVFSLLSSSIIHAELKLPAIIGDNMVLQQKQANPVWGWDTPGSQVKVIFSGQTKTATCEADGKWTVKLDPVPANAKPQTMSIEGSSKRELKNILVGEVWLCSGQSNMGMTVSSSWDADLESLTTNYPNLRLISVPQVGTQEPQKDFKGQWEAATPETCKDFTAVGFFFGRVLHQALNVPVGLIDNAWGGSACEAWIRRDVIEKDARFKDIISLWKGTEANFKQEDFEKQVAAHKEKTLAWAQARREALKAGKPEPAPLPRAPQNPMTGQHRPGNLYAGVLHPLIGYGIKGAIWYQGESNSGRAQEYGALFPAMIQHWRDEWKQGDFPFYWVQLADFKAYQARPGDSDWAELRESQTKTMSLLKNTGQAVITDLGEANDIHPKNKRDVADRLVRWALAKDYGIKIPYSSPMFKEVKFEGAKALVSFSEVGTGLRTVDVGEVSGFAICGEDRKWVWADAKILGNDKIEVSSKSVAKPVAVRYAWADNPVCNVYSKEGLPVTPFRTDDFPMITDAKALAEKAAALKKFNEERQARLKQREEVKKAAAAKTEAKK